MALKREKEVVEFEKANFHGAGINIGSRDIFVSTDGITEDIHGRLSFLLPVFAIERHIVGCHGGNRRLLDEFV
jgi:hypothetical protein